MPAHDGEGAFGARDDLPETGCEESRLAVSRRSLLGVSAGLFSWSMMPSVALAGGGGGDPRLLVVVLRGGMDGLSTVVPHGDDDYRRARGRLAIAPDRLHRIDGLFGLHPELSRFAGMMRAGEAAVLHAVAGPVRNRSHFDCQDNLENGLPGRSDDATGWLNRMLGTLPAGDPVRARGAVHVGKAPLILHGAEPVMGWAPPVFPTAPGVVGDVVCELYDEADPLLGGNLAFGLRTHEIAASAVPSGDLAGLSGLRRGFVGAAGLMRQAEGPRVCVLSVDGWDTHALQGGATGQLADRLRDLDGCLDAYRRLMGAVWRRTVVLVVTEFGRTVRINGTEGSDHGVGTVALLAGGAVRGGRVLGDWPGLRTRDLADGRDLRATTDIRALFKGILADHFDIPRARLDTVVFPGSAAVAPLRGLVRA